MSLVLEHVYAQLGREEVVGTAIDAQVELNGLLREGPSSRAQSSAGKTTVLTELVAFTYDSRML